MGGEFSVTLLEETLALLDVAREAWLTTSRHDRAREADARARAEHVAARQARLRLLTTRLARLHALDAQVDLLLLSTLPERDALVAKLRNVRAAVEREARAGTTA